jgi:SAM-dependent methyltransferase
MPAESPYDEIAAYYDLEHRSFTDDVDLYLQFIEAAGDPVLELGCGTGRIVRQIAVAGYDVTGIDSSIAMLAHARVVVDATEYEGAIEFIEGDFARNDLVEPGSFGVVIIALDSLLHALTQEDQIRVIQSAWSALDPRGQLIVDVVNPTPPRLMAMDGGLTFAGSWPMEDGSRLDKLVAQTADSTNQRIENEIWYEVTAADGALKRTRTAFAQRWIGAGELVLMLQLAGFQDWRVYGSYELDVLEAHSERIIIAAEKTKTG